MSASLKAALEAALANKQATETPAAADVAPKAKRAPKATPAETVASFEDALAERLSPDQVEAIEGICALALSRAIHEQAREDDMSAIEDTIREHFARPLSWDDWQPITSAIRNYAGPSPAMTFRNAYKAVHGALPSAGTGSGSGRKGVSPKRAAAGLHARVDALAEFIADTLETQRDKLNGLALAEIAAAVVALKRAEANILKAA